MNCIAKDALKTTRKTIQFNAWSYVNFSLCSTTISIKTFFMAKNLPPKQWIERRDSDLKKPKKKNWIKEFN